MEHGGKLNVKCNPSAFKHGITEADIRFAMVSLDPITATYLQAKAAVTHYSPSEIIGELVRKELSAAASV